MALRTCFRTPPATLLAALVLLVPAAEAGAAAGVFEAGAFPELIEAGQPVDIAAADALVADFNGDGHRDVFIAMGRTQGLDGIEIPRADRLYLGDGLGAFARAATPFDAATPRAATGAVAADFNRDGRLDLVVLGGSVYLGPVPGVRTEPSVVYTGQAVTLFDAGSTLALVSAQPVVHAVAADIDGDSDPDLLVRQTNGALRVLRNTGAPGAAIAFELAQEIAIGSSDPRNRLAVGRFAGEDAAPDVALLVPTGGTVASGVRVLRNTGGTPPFQTHADIALPAPLVDLAAGDFDADGRDDLIVVADAEDPQPQWSRARVVWSEANGFRVGDERFPGNGLRRVAVGDLDADGRPDLVFGRLREQGPAPRDVPSLLIALNRNLGFQPTSQCLGRYAGVPAAIRIAPVDGDALADIVVMGAAPQVEPRTGPGWWRNNASNIAGACCMAELAAQGITAPPPPGPNGLFQWLAAAASAVDLRAYSGVRDQLLPAATNGPRLRQRYDTFSAEIAQRMRSDPVLWIVAATALSRWSEPVARLLAGQGASRTVSTEMIDAVDAALNLLSATGSPALVDAIAFERAQLPPLQDLVGLDMNQFRAAVLPAQRIHDDQFEAVTP
jgi:hypothetical protein